MPFGGTSSAALAMQTPPKPPAAPKPGPDWVPTADGQGWLPPDRAGTAGAAAVGDAGGTPGTTTGGVKPPSALPTPTPSTTVTGANGTASLTTSPTGATTGQAPGVGLGATTAADPLQVLMRQRVTDLLQTPTTASVTDADVAPAAQAYAAGRERLLREQQRQALEQANSQGLASSGALQGQQAQAAETAGRDIGGYNAQLVLDRMQQHQQALQAGVQVASQMGMTQEAQNLSRQLANLNAQMSMFGLAQGQQGQQAQTALANLDTQTKTYLANLDADLRRQGYSTTERLQVMQNQLGKYGIDVQGNLGLLNAVVNLLGQNQQNTQFNQTLGANLGMWGANFNNNLITSLLGGG